MKNKYFFAFSMLLCLAIAAKSTAQIRPKEKPSYTLYLIGDAGDANLASSNLSAFYRMLLQENTNSAAVFLGDNLYPAGLSKAGSRTRIKEEETLESEFARLKSYKGRAFIIPGNHDWATGKKDGRNAVLRQAAYIKTLLAKDSVFLPLNGCPGPAEISLSEEITLLVLDTEWMLYPWHTPQTVQGCENQSVSDVLIALEDALARNKNKTVIVAAHHPVFTYGNHGGRFTFKQHVFPLTQTAKWLYLPLPAIGSAYPFARSIGASPQDISNASYKTFRKAFEKIFSKYQNIIYASGHEHALQYILKDGVHYIVSGSGSKTEPVFQGKYSEFAQSRKGYAKISFYKQGDAWLDIYNGEGEQPEKPVFSKFLMKKRYVPQLTEKEYASLNLKDSMVVVPASTKYKAGKTMMFFMGKNYREEWSTPVKVPVFDIGSEHGGLEIIKKGGGQATKSLRLEDKKGNQYVLRSVEKFPLGAVPEILHGTIATDAVQDQISSSHPYAAVTVPAMADAVGIYHTNPKIVYIPDDPRLGIYRTAFANTLCLYEERPSKNEGKIKSFGFAKKIKSTPDVAEYLEEDNDNEIDYPFVLRSRLFDMVLGDWDRHEDQWRWARFKNKNKGYTFRPIPRDRDQVFFVNQGLLPKIASRRWILPKFEGFNNDIRWEEGFNFNARFFDRSFLNQASLNDWLAQADSIQRRLTDEIIKQAIKESLPEKIYAINGETLVKKLIARRDKLKTVARNYYKALAKKVDVVGTSKNEQFLINRFDDGNVQITVRKISKKGKLKHITYQRLFKHNETKEVRLYGLGGKDEFKATGSSRKGVKVRVILKGKDNAFEDETTGAKSSQIKLYNVPEKESIRKGKSTKLKTLPRGTLAEYNRRAFKYNQAFPLAAAGYNPDDKISLAAGTHIIAHGFNKEPYASSQTILAGVSLLGNAFSLKYKGDFTDFIGDFNLRIAADASVPSFISNYYGLGNSTSNKPDRVFNNKSSEMDFFRLRYMRILIDAGLHSKIGDRSQYTFGLRYLINEVFDNEYTDDKFIADFSENGLTPGEAYGAKEYGGLNFNYIYDHRNNPSLPESGFYFHLDASAYQRLGKNRRLAKIESDLSLYWTVRLPLRLTFATRFGSAVNFGGNYNFNMYNKLGGSKNLRGYRKDRFYGQSMFFNNIDLRLRLLNIHSSILPMTLGVIGFNDVGRVWLSGEKSKKWHWGYGGGIYVAPLNIVAFSLFSGFSEEGTNIYAKIGFSF